MANRPTSRSRASALLAITSLVACGTGSVVAAEDAGTPDVRAPDARPDVQTASSECEPKVAPDAPVPAPYGGRRNPLSPTPAILSAGKTRFDGRCALCHGSEGHGDGREGPFVPPAADLAAKVRSADYLFWRISEGGNVDPFCTAMPAFGTLYSEQARWELVAYVGDLARAGDASTADAGD